MGVPKDRNIGGGNNELGDDSSSQINLDDLVKKAYRKKSIKHHPDKPGGDAETFRILKRAQTVLSNPKLRQQVIFYCYYFMATMIVIPFYYTII